MIWGPLEKLYNYGIEVAGDAIDYVEEVVEVVVDEAGNVIGVDPQTLKSYIFDPVTKTQQFYTDAFLKIGEEVGLNVEGIRDIDNFLNSARDLGKSIVMDQGVQKLQAEVTQNAVNSISALAEGDLDGAYTYLVDENIEYISNYGENVFTENEELAKAATKEPKLTSLKDNEKVLDVVLDPSVTLTVKECEGFTS